MGSFTADHVLTATCYLYITGSGTTQEQTTIATGIFTLHPLTFFTKFEVDNSNIFVVSSLCHSLHTAYTYCLSVPNSPLTVTIGTSLFIEMIASLETKMQ